ncbi:hypothetical protein MAMO4S_04157 [Mesorhizobium amorphae]
MMMSFPLTSYENRPPLRLGLRPIHLSPISWGRGTQAGEAPALRQRFLAPAKRGRGGSGVARDGEEVFVPRALPRSLATRNPGTILA